MNIVYLLHGLSSDPRMMGGETGMEELYGSPCMVTYAPLNLQREETK